MVDATKDEGDLIAEMKEDVAAVKALLDQIEHAAAKVARINAGAGRPIQAGHAMIWQGAVMRMRGDLLAAHGAASIALVKGYDNGSEIVALGPIR
jgi:hypothetical protein